MKKETSASETAPSTEPVITTPLAPSPEEKPKRDYTIDNYRGFVIFIVFLWCCMFLPFRGFSWVQHTDRSGIDIAFGIMDYGILMFLLAAGLIMNLVFKRRAERTGDYKKTRGYYAKRGLILMGVGAIDLVFKDIGDTTITSPYGWEVFMSIGFACTLASPFLGRKAWIRILAGALIIVFFGLIAEYVPIVHDSLYNSKRLTYGGPFGAIGMAGLLLWFTVLGDYFHSDKKKFALGVLILWLLAIPSIVISFSDCTATVSNLVIEDLSVIKRFLCVSFVDFTPGFLLFGGAFATLTFLPIWGISALIKKEIPFIATMGKNTIIFFFVYAIMTIPSSMIFKAIPSSPAGATVLNALLVIAVSFPLAYLFKKKNWILKV